MTDVIWETEKYFVDDKWASFLKNRRNLDLRKHTEWPGIGSLENTQDHKKTDKWGNLRMHKIG